MAYKKQLRDKNGNVVYPDVGLNLDDVVYSDDPSESIGDIIDPNSYSTNETLTGGTWVDGKPIYRKCYTGTINITANTRVSEDLEPNSDIENIINVGGYMGYSSGTKKGRNTVPSAECNASGTMTNFIMVSLVAADNTLRLTRYSNADRGWQPYAVWVEYTKSS